jgi:hypothetical protein
LSTGAIRERRGFAAITAGVAAAVAVAFAFAVAAAGSPPANLDALPAATGGLVLTFAFDTRAPGIV